MCTHKHEKTIYIVAPSAGCIKNCSHVLGYFQEFSDSGQKKIALLKVLWYEKSAIYYYYYYHHQAIFYKFSNKKSIYDNVLHKSGSVCIWKTLYKLSVNQLTLNKYYIYNLLCMMFTHYQNKMLYNVLFSSVARYKFKEFCQRYCAHTK